MLAGVREHGVARRVRAGGRRPGRDRSALALAVDSGQHGYEQPDLSAADACGRDQRLVSPSRCADAGLRPYAPPAFGRRAGSCTATASDDVLTGGAGPNHVEGAFGAGRISGADVR